MEGSQTKTIWDALAAFKDTVGNIIPNAVNPFFKSKYATLQEIMEGVIPALAAQDLVLLQVVKNKGQVLTTLYHLPSSQKIESDLDFTEGMSEPQKLGAAITYARRYSIVTMLGLTTEPDDDANITKKDPFKMTEQIENGINLYIKQRQSLDNILGLIKKKFSVTIDNEQEIEMKYHELKGATDE